MAAGLVGVSWAGAIAAYLPVYERFDGPPAAADDAGVAAAIKWGGATGGAGSLAVAGTAALLLFRDPPSRYVAVVCLFVFGTVLLCLALGMRVVASRLPPAPAIDAADTD